MGTVKQVIQNKPVKACVQIIASSQNGYKGETPDAAISRGIYVSLNVRTEPSQLKGIMNVYFEIPLEWSEKYSAVYFRVNGFQTPRVALPNYPNKKEANTNADLGYINEKTVFLGVRHL